MSMKGNLTVRNFGPLKEIKIDLRQINVFIGQQGVGKSILSKLIAIFKEMKGLDSNHESDFLRLLRQYQLIPFVGENISTFIYHEDNFEVHFKISEREITRTRLLTERTPKMNIAIYIPADRLFLTAYLNSINSILKNNIPIPTTIRNFASYYEQAKLDTNSSPGGYYYIDFLDVDVNVDGEKIFVHDSKRDYDIELGNAASGFQSSIPMSMIIQHYVELLTDVIQYTFVIEEPEQNLYPLTQIKLIQSLIRSCNLTPEQKHNLTITTHSPYIISAIDDLIQAGEIARRNPELINKVDKLIPKESWLKFSDVSAYYITEKGTVQNLLDKKLKGIKGNKMDDITKEYEEIYGELMHLKYHNQKADVL